MCDQINNKKRSKSTIYCSYSVLLEKTIDLFCLTLGCLCKRPSIAIQRQDPGNFLNPEEISRHYRPLPSFTLFLLIALFLMPLNPALAEDNCPLISNSVQTDTDADGVGDICDNCLLFVNPNQIDTDADGFGNPCDGDLDNNNIVNVLDLNHFRNAFGTSDAHADFNGDGIVNVLDLNSLRTFFGYPPGPTGVTAKLDNHRPVADAGPDQTTTTGQTVHLDATQSTDVDGGPLLYLWSFNSIPTGSAATLSNQQSVSPTFVVDLAGLYDVELEVWDGTARSVADSISVLVALDSDGDGIPDDEDICPNDTINHCITITGQVFANGALLPNAAVKVGLNSVITTTDTVGAFTANVGPAELAYDNLNVFFPVEVATPGYSAAYAKVYFIAGKTEYAVSLHLLPEHDIISRQEDVSLGVDIKKNGEKIGELAIPPVAFPAGVTEIKGSMTYLDPQSDDLRFAPGGDLLGLSTGSGPNTVPTPVETFGMIDFNMVDQNGNPVHQLSAPAEICMQAIAGLQLGADVPLWYFDKTRGLWIEEGQGSLVDRNGQLMICGSVSHFTWWNFVNSLSQRSCFKFQIIDESTGNSLDSLNWIAEGVTYTGLSSNLYCSLYNIDLNPPVPGNNSEALDIKRSTATATEQIRVYTSISGSKFYLQSDGDGTYSLTQIPADAAVFDTPQSTGNGSCINSIDLQNCQNLDYQDNNADGILPLLANTNLPPLISQVQFSNYGLAPGGFLFINSKITDPEGTDVAVAWSAFCNDFLTGNEAISPNQKTGISGQTFFANFRAPAALNAPIVHCRITLKATDTEGFTSTAERWIIVAGQFDVTIQGILYGLDGLPLPQYEITCNDNPFSVPPLSSESILTDQTGHYRFEVSTADCDGSFLTVDYSYQSIPWTLDTNGLNCRSQPGANALCNRNIRLPVVWAPMNGNIFQPQTGMYNDFKISANSQGSMDSNSTNIPVNLSGTTYGPFQVPLGDGGVISFNTTPVIFNRPIQQGYNILNTQGLVHDIGDATGQVVITHYDDAGQAIPGVDIFTNENDAISPNSQGFNGTTDAQGQFSAEPALGSLLISSNYISEIFNTEFGFFTDTFIDTKDQQVLVDIYSPDTCTVTGVAFDSKGAPWPNVTVKIKSFQTLNAEIFQVQTDSEGKFVFNNISTGQHSIYTTVDTSTFSFNYFQFPLSIDNCRPDNGNPRIINVDVPFVDPQFTNFNSFF